jgi:hypothetical protein
LIEPYRVASLINLEENLNFHIFDDSIVDDDVEKLNVILISSEQAQVYEDDDDIHIEDCDGVDDNSIEEEENSH